MNAAGAAFAGITAALEDMHAIAVEGQSGGLLPDEGLTLLSMLRVGIDRLERQFADARAALIR